MISSTSMTTSTPTLHNTKNYNKSVRRRSSSSSSSIVHDIMLKKRTIATACIVSSLLVFMTMPASGKAWSLGRVFKRSPRRGGGGTTFKTPDYDTIPATTSSSTAAATNAIFVENSMINDHDDHYSYNSFISLKSNHEDKDDAGHQQPQSNDRAGEGDRDTLALIYDSLNGHHTTQTSTRAHRDPLTTNTQQHEKQSKAKQDKRKKSKATHNNTKKINVSFFSARNDHAVFTNPTLKNKAQLIMNTLAYILPLLLVAVPLMSDAWVFGGKVSSPSKSACVASSSAMQKEPTAALLNGIDGNNHASPIRCHHDRAGEGDRDTLALIYDSLNGESDTLDKIVGSLDSKSTLEQWHVTAIKSLWDVHADNINKHFDITETFLLPKLKKHASTIPDAAIIRSHRSLKAQVSSIQSSISVLRPGRLDKKYRRNLAHELNAYNSDLRDHFAFKKRSVLNQSKSAMTPFQWGRTLQKYMEKGGVEMGSFIHHMGVETFRQEWMSFCKLPQFLWGVHFKKGWEKFDNNWQRHVSALERNVAPSF
eukprot:CAMPEP_0119570582 /NCGR_PEP_ID=MMETSP1352-20130426/43686_1 /TAXON_ID=265584 /ORGANISM="Stauroneis constricta, Strain CCMP1120" /LENGTH=535 /DNA_ID=CAMNT_0007620251 /DNA_START=119 /DNA_END=1727 /DNA_ORIENTATION=-